MRGLLLIGAVLLLHVSAWAQNTESKYDRPGFVFIFPKTWHVADKDQNFNADTYFTLESPGNTTLQVQVFTLEEDELASSEEDLLYRAMELLDGTLIDVVGRSSIDSIGPLSGAGRHLTGNVMFFYPGGAKVFFHRKGERVLRLTLIYWQEEYSVGDKCLEQVASSFQFK